MKKERQPPLPFRPQPFLFRTLVGIFFVEFIFLGFAFVKCAEPIPDNPEILVTDRCPRLAQRSQEVFQVGIATVLSLLGGAAIASQKPSSGGGGASVPGSSLPKLPPEGPEGPRSPSRARKSQRPEPPEEG